MSRQFPLAITAAPQILPISGGELGFHKIFIGFGTAPTSGFVSVEKRAIGSINWAPIEGGENVPIVGGEASIYTDGAISGVGSTGTSFQPSGTTTLAGFWMRACHITQAP
jgi:hypothetical protein